MVTEQAKEIGVRMALGASAGLVQRGVVARTMKLALWCLIVGIGVAIGAGRSMQSLLYGISAMDPIAIIATSITLLVAHCSQAICQHAEPHASISWWRSAPTDTNHPTP
jgi:hypothetical protein